MLKLRGHRAASTVLLLLAAGVSAAAWSDNVQEGFHPLAMLACLLPLQCAALVWAWQRVPD